MDKDERKIVLASNQGDKDSVDIVCTVVFCESSASLMVGNLTVHIPWSELAVWQAWLANRVEEEA